MARLADNSSWDPNRISGDDAFLQREFPMSRTNFRLISAIAHKGSGIVLTDAKQEMVYSRLARRLRDLGINSFDQYLTSVVHNECGELNNFLNAITTNLTSFFRENHHFENLKSTVLPELKLRNAATRRLRLWSTACSTGEEAYSLAMVLRECSAQFKDWDITILATDLDSEVVQTAKNGIYDRSRIESISTERQARWFKPVSERQVEIDDSLKSMVDFKQLNLLDRWPIMGRFDIVFCRNVIIYFDKDTQRDLFKKIHQMMNLDSFLFIGHSENLMSVSDQFESKGGTIYLRR